MWLYVLYLRYITAKYNPSLTVWSLPLLLNCHQFLFLYCLTVSPCRYCFQSFSVPQLDPFLSLISLLSLPRVHRGHKTMAAIQPLQTSCADWHRSGGNAHIVLRCCREVTDNREPKPSTKWYRKLQPYLFICLWLSVINIHGQAQKQLLQMQS